MFKELILILKTIRVVKIFLAKYYIFNKKKQIKRFRENIYIIYCIKSAKCLKVNYKYKLKDCFYIDNNL